MPRLNKPQRLDERKLILIELCTAELPQMAVDFGWRENMMLALNGDETPIEALEKLRTIVPTVLLLDREHPAITAARRYDPASGGLLQQQAVYDAIDAAPEPYRRFASIEIEARLEAYTAGEFPLEPVAKSLWAHLMAENW